MDGVMAASTTFRWFDSPRCPCVKTLVFCGSGNRRCKSTFAQPRLVVLGSCVGAGHFPGIVQLTVDAGDIVLVVNFKVAKVRPPSPK